MATNTIDRFDPKVMIAARVVTVLRPITPRTTATGEYPSIGRATLAPLVEGMRVEVDDCRLRDSTLSRIVRTCELERTPQQ